MPAGDPGSALFYDLLLHVLDHFHDDYGTLYRCSLVNWEFNRAALRLLYSRVVFSPPFRPVLNLKDRGVLSVSSGDAPSPLPMNDPP